MQAQWRPLSGGRLHFQHGPMDIVIGADGQAEALRLAHASAWQRFRGLLQELVAELPLLRAPISGPCRLQGPVARRMWQAAQAHSDVYVTPMVAVAGAVAQELIAAYQRPGISRAWVNNGGDIALHLSPGTSLKVGLFADLDRLVHLNPEQDLPVDGVMQVDHASGVRGVATSGWKGRSFSLGIADSVTVLASTAAQADAAASIIGNAVNVQAPGIVRRPACELKDDTDLGALPVTVDVPPLSPAQLAQALAAGLAQAEQLKRCGLLADCIISCQGQVASTWQTSRPALHATAPRREAQPA